MADTPSIVSGKVTSSTTLVEKYESGSGTNKINVRIFKAPMAEPVVQALQDNAQTKQGDPGSKPGKEF